MTAKQCGTYAALAWHSRPDDYPTGHEEIRQTYGQAGSRRAANMRHGILLLTSFL